MTDTDTDTDTDLIPETDRNRDLNSACLESFLGRSLATGHMRDRSEVVAILDRMAEDQVSSVATERHRSKGKFTAWERVERLFDADTFQEFGALRRHRNTGMGMENNRPFRDGVVTGWGLIHGRTAFCYALDSRVLGGSLGETQAEKIHKCLDMALSAGAPIIAIHDGAGARVQEGGLALAGFGGIFRRHVAASGVVPQLSLIMGACAGGSAYAPALTDMIFMVRGLSQMVITGPDVIAAVTGERPDLEFLGGAEAHSTRSGVASFVYEDEESCLEEVRWLLQLLPSSVNELPPEYSTDDPTVRPCERLLDVVPAEDHVAYDVREVITEIVDEGEFLEVQANFAGNIVCALARIGGKSIGIVANQPLVLAGAMDIDSSSKAARFVGFCDAFHLPIVSLVDVPGFLPGVDQEHGGIIRHGAKLIFAYCRSTVPRIQVIMRKAFGGAYIVMDSPSIGADFSVAWPTHKIGVMGSEGAVDLIYRREIAAAPDPTLRRMELIEMYEGQVMQPMKSAELGLVDRIINPMQTREVIADALRTFQYKRYPFNAVVHGVHPT